jgi:hypothetical protein
VVVMDKWTFRVVFWNCLVKGGVQTTRFQLWLRSRVGAGEMIEGGEDWLSGVYTIVLAVGYECLR